MLIYGSDDETVIQTDRGIFLVQSPNMCKGDKYKRLTEIPENMERIPEEWAWDLINNLPAEIFDSEENPKG